MAVEWSQVLLAFLHDPPDKAFAVNARNGVPGHESRRLELAKAILGDDDVTQAQIRRTTASLDVMAAQIERLPMPKGVHVNVADGLQAIHPLSGKCESLPLPDWTQELLEAQKKTLLSIAGDFEGANRFIAIWRHWPEELSKQYALFGKIPAETRTPDHTIWHHLDITAAFGAAKSEGHEAALLAFALGPVQRFIEAARSVRDLWSGSMILSWLAFRSMLPIIEQLGPTALIYPALRGNPMLDLWLRDAERLGENIPPPKESLRRTPALPHRFLALVPWGKDGACARDLAARCEKAVADSWLEMAQAVRQRISYGMAGHCPDWDKRWDSQVEGYFSTATAVIPLDESGEAMDGRLAKLLTGKHSFKEAFPNAEAVRELARAIPTAQRPSYDQEHAGRWQYQVEVAQRSLAALRNIRHVPPNPPAGNNGERSPQKCTLLGSLEQVGPDDLQRSKEFWDKVADSNSGLSVDGVRIRQGEALCALALAKRFAGPACLVKQLGIQPAMLRFPDTWTVAAAEWLNHAEIDPDQVRQDYGDWNGQWLSWNTERDDPDEPPCPGNVLNKIKSARSDCGKPPVYYAILRLDGDDLGGWLRGDKSPQVREVMHPTLVTYYEGLGEQAKAALNAKRPVGPALHAAISTSLANFALHAVPEIVRKHYGMTIYSGGDDTLVLMPVSKALACALELCKAFTSDFYTAAGREYLMMGGRATLSGGLVVVHAKDDLRLALQDARHAENQAKDAGKDALAITIRRRSGEHTSVVCPWALLPTVNDWTEQFRKGASDRWAYHLYLERSSLAYLSLDAMQAEIRRQIMRAEEPTPTRIPPGSLAAAFQSFCSRFDSAGEALSSFLTLCHTASFLARGRDRS